MKSNWFFVAFKMIIIILSFYEFKGKFECVWENTEKYKTFSIPIKFDIDGIESVVIISYKTNCTDNARFMVTSLSNLVDNLAEGIHKIKCKDCDYFL